MAETMDQIFVILKHWLVAHSPVAVQPIVAPLLSAEVHRWIPDPHHDILTPEEVIPFFTALAPGERPIFAAAIFTGLRKSELCGFLQTEAEEDEPEEKPKEKE